jgi:hypothetical protein
MYGINDKSYSIIKSRINYYTHLFNRWWIHHSMVKYDKFLGFYNKIELIAYAMFWHSDEPKHM